jgi:hypothetical protein
MNIWQTIKSVLAAMLGVQSSANRNRDFESGNLVIFITAGLVITIVFMLVLFLFVDQIVLR